MNVITTSSAIENLINRTTETYLKGRNLKTQIAYRKRLEKFLEWRARQPEAPFIDHLKDYISYLSTDKENGGAGLSPHSVQAHVNTIKGMVRTMAVLEPTVANFLPALDLAKAPSVHGEVQGNRLDRRQRDRLINLPGVNNHKGRRDTAILGLMADCGLRRSEVIGLCWKHIAEIDGHKVIKNLKGKHGRVRTIKLPVPLWRLIITWAANAAIDAAPDAPLFVAIRKGDHVQHGQRLSTAAIGWLVDQYGEILKAGDFMVPEISPHDLRRTAASLARRGGASIEQVQIMLGHASPQTTSAYIGETLDLDDHAVDYSKVEYPELGR